MNNPLFQAICRTGIFMICAQAIVQFRPNESYEKYLKLLVSVMVLVQLFLPIGRLFTGSGKLEADALLASFRENLEQGMEEVRRQAEETDALLQQMTLEEVRKRMEEQKAASGKEEDEATANDEDVEATAKDGNVESSAEDGALEESAKEKDMVKTAKEEGEETASGAGDEPVGGRVTIEVEPIAPILGEKTGGMQEDGEQVE